MTVATSATTPASFEIKSANLPLVALLLKSADLTVLAHEMALRFGDIPDFFDQDPVVIDLAPLQRKEAKEAEEAEEAKKLPEGSAGEASKAGKNFAHSQEGEEGENSQQSPASIDSSEVDFPALMALLASYRLVPVAVKGGSAEQMAAAQQAGLLCTPDAHLLSPKPATPAAQSPAAPQAPPAPAAPLAALIIDKPLRSGQQVYARGRDLVVMAMVNAGAEVIADGHIHVYAPLRGKAMAGARGNTEARIFALALEAELLSIAGIYRTGENPLPPSVAGLPAQVRLVAGEEGGDGDKLVMTPLSD